MSRRKPYPCALTGFVCVMFSQGSQSLPSVWKSWSSLWTLNLKGVFLLLQDGQGECGTSDVLRFWFSYADSDTDNFLLEFSPGCLSCSCFLARLSPTLHALEIGLQIKRHSLHKILFQVSFKDGGFRNCGKGLGLQNGERLHRSQTHNEHHGTWPNVDN